MQPPRQPSISMVYASVVVLPASQITVVSTTHSPSNSYHDQQQSEPAQLMTPTKSDRHVDELRRQHNVVKPFKSPRRKWFVARLCFRLTAVVVRDHSLSGTQNFEPSCGICPFLWNVYVFAEFCGIRYWVVI